MKQKKGYAGAKTRFRNRMKMMAIAILSIVGIACYFCDSESAVALALAAPAITLVKKGSGLSEEEEALLKKFEGAINQGMEEWAAGLIDKGALDAKMTEIKKDMREALASEFVSQKSVNELNDVIRELGNEVKTMKDRGIDLTPGSELTKALDDVLSNQKFKDFCDGVAGKRSGKISLDLLKGIVSLTNNYHGNILTTQQSNRIIVDVNERRINMRDLITVEQGDPAFTSITYGAITNLDRNAASVSENGRLPESSFEMREETANMSRIGTYVNISKRLLKSRIYLRSFLMNRLPKWVRMAEDFQILFGDGQGDNLKGLAKNSFNISEWLTEVVVTGIAGDVAAITSYDDGKATMVEFSKPFSKLEEGMKITFAGAPSGFSALNGEHLVHKYNDNKIMIDVPYKSTTAEEAKAITFTAKNNFFNQVVDPTLADAINAGFAVLTYGEFTPNMLALNPSDVFQIETEKDTTGRSLGLIVANGGVKYIYGRPIVESTAIAPGYYFMGDMANGASLVDYTTLTIEFAEDVETKLHNYVTVIAQEEVMMPIYNKFAFSYGKLSDLLSAITKS